MKTENEILRDNVSEAITALCADTSVPRQVTIMLLRTLIDSIKTTMRELWILSIQEFDCALIPDPSARRSRKSDREQRETTAMSEEKARSPFTKFMDGPQRHPPLQPPETTSIAFHKSLVAACKSLLEARDQSDAVALWRAVGKIVQVMDAQKKGEDAG